MAGTVRVVIDVDAASGTAAIKQFMGVAEQLPGKIQATEPAAGKASAALGTLSQAKQKATAAAQALGQKMTRLGGLIGQTAGAVLGLASKLAGPAGLGRRAGRDGGSGVRDGV